MVVEHLHDERSVLSLALVVNECGVTLKIDLSQLFHYLIESYAEERALRNCFNCYVPAEFPDY